jgi:hypothetical protein
MSVAEEAPASFLECQLWQRDGRVPAQKSEDLPNEQKPGRHRTGGSVLLPHHGKSTRLVQMQRSFLFQSGFAASRRHLCNWLMWTKIQSSQALEETNDTEVLAQSIAYQTPQRASLRAATCRVGARVSPLTSTRWNERGAAFPRSRRSPCMLILRFHPVSRLIPR